MAASHQPSMQTAGRADNAPFMLRDRSPAPSTYPSTPHWTAPAERGVFKNDRRQVHAAPSRQEGARRRHPHPCRASPTARARISVRQPPVLSPLSARSGRRRGEPSIYLLTAASAGPPAPDAASAALGFGRRTQPCCTEWQAMARAGATASPWRSVKGQFASSAQPKVWPRFSRDDAPPSLLSSSPTITGLDLDRADHRPLQRVRGRPARHQLFTAQPVQKRPRRRSDRASTPRP